MSAWLVEAHLWIKACHIVAAIAWMAGMLYLPRLFVYHASALPGGESSEMLKVMERRLLWAIVSPALAASLLFGILLALTPGAVDWSEGWPYVKLACVLALVVLYALDIRWQRGFAEDRNRRGPRFYRAVNEAPTLLMLGAVVAVVVEPF